MTPHESWYEPIPRWLHSARHERPFDACHVCRAKLGSSVQYTIMKSFQRDECVFEMAICRACSEEQCERWSNESREAALDFQIRSLDHIDHQEGERCDYCGKPIDQTAGVAVFARCDGDRLWMTSHMCYPCEDELQEQLSPATREEHDRFMRLHFPGPPGLEQPITSERPAELVSPRVDIGRATLSSSVSTARWRESCPSPRP